MKIQLSRLKKHKKAPKARLPGEPRPFKTKSPVRESTVLPRHEATRAGPDRIEQRRKEQALRELLKEYVVSNETLLKAILQWERN